jgi:O-antigen/teichoic acid export membrane protein
MIDITSKRKFSGCLLVHIKAKLQPILSFMGIDRATFWALSSKLWQMGSGLLTTLMVAKFFSQEEQGYYYTFLSVLSLQIFAEFGLGIVVSSNASHEWAHLQLDVRGHIRGNQDSLSRLIGLGGFAKKCYLKISAASLLLLLFGGSLFFLMKSSHNIDLWLLPWCFLSLLTAISLYLVPFWSILEGCNQVESVYMFRLAQTLIAGFVAWAAIYFGFGLWALSLAGFIGIFLILVLMYGRYKNFFARIFYSKSFGAKVNWRGDILPMQWRIGVSWIGGYLTFSLFVPVVFYFKGPILAGQTGMTLAFVSAVTGVISSWVSPKAPAFGILIAQSKFHELDRMFYQLSLRVILIAVSMAILIWLGIYFINELHFPLAERLLPPLPAAFFLGGAIVLCAGLPMSTYLRAHKKEPLLIVSILCGVFTSTSVFLSAKYSSINMMAFMYFLSISIFTPFIFLIWIKFRRENHIRGFEN